MSAVRYIDEHVANNQPAMAYDAVDDQNIELATGKALGKPSLFVHELWHRRAAPVAI